jgi:putative transposase
MIDENKEIHARKIQVKRGSQAEKELDHNMFLSKNLSNTCIYIQRNHFFTKRDCQDPKLKSEMKSFLTFVELIKMLQDSNQVDYRALPAAVAQQVCIQVCNEFISFFKKLKNGDKTARIPKYKDKVKGRNKLSYPKNAISTKELRNGYIKLTGINTKFKIPDGIDYKDIQRVDIVKKSSHIEVVIMYKVPKVELKEKNNRYMGADLGLNNLITVASNVKGITPMIFDGRPIKAINQFYNKYVSELQSKLTKKGKEKYTSNKIYSITRNRYNKIKDYFHKISTYLINQAVSNGITAIFIGLNKEWKQEIKLGKNNQKFVEIPFDILIDMITYKAKDKGIDVITTEESYTSKCSFFDNEEMCHHDKYQGKRIKRGRKTINSDVNGALNIIRKVIPTFSCETAKLEVADVANPVRISFRNGNLFQASKRLSL